MLFLQLKKLVVNLSIVLKYIVSIDTPSSENTFMLMSFIG